MKRLAGAMIVTTMIVAPVADAQRAPTTVVTATDADDGKVLRVPVGGELLVRLRQQAGTPYRWELRRDPRATLARPVETIDRTSDGRVGGPQDRQFRVRIVGAGRFPVIFGLISAVPGPAKPPARRIVFTVDTTVQGTPRPAASAAVSIDAEGLRLVNMTTGATRPIAFGTTRADTLAALRTFGTPQEGTDQDCGAGPLSYARFANGLTLQFQDDAFAGWSIGRRNSGTVTTMSGIRPGSTRAELDKAYDIQVERSSIGIEFSAGDMGGVLDGTRPTARITDLWAGVTCIAR